MNQDFYLASRSPRRAELLRRAGFRFECLPVDVPEIPRKGESPLDFAARLALHKAETALERSAEKLPVLGADTDVSVDGEILGKPQDREDAVRMLLKLSNRGHEVISAIALATPAAHAIASTKTEVIFAPISRAEAEAYWDSGEPVDKAGAYAIQGYAARWVREVRGSYTGVVGLPLVETIELLRRFGVEPR